ncbi:MAG: type VI secretion system protein VasG [Planctomycetota bacterium]|jgi:type VI secretion system protein VasG
MAQLNLKSLIGRMNPSTTRALEGAAGLCLSRTHYNVEIEHWLLKLLEDQGNDFNACLRRFEIDPGRLERDLTQSIDKFKSGNSRPPALSPSVVDLARDAWLVTSIEYQEGATRTGHILDALMSSDTMARQARGMSSEFENLSAESLRREYDVVTADSNEAATSVASAPGGSSPAAKKTGGKTPSLDQYCVDLTAKARSGAIDPVLGRDSEVRQVIDILTRRRQNNPILTGEPGVGKTAVAEGFALRVIEGDVPPSLQNIQIQTLDLALLQAGAGMKGEFENRLKGVIDEVKASPTPIVMFIDEAHTLIGAGGQAGSGDAANLLKPALARGELRTIAATTWAEYKKYIEKDAALARRFQVVKIEEPDENVGIQIMRGLSSMMEAHHGVRVMDEALEASVRMSMRYIPGRQLPDKSVSVLDTACARVALSQAATPSQIEDAQRHIRQCEVSIGIFERENAAKPVHTERIEELNEQKAASEVELAALQERWEREKVLVGELQELRKRLESSVRPKDATEGEAPEPIDSDEGRSRMATLTEELEKVQGDSPLVQDCVGSQAIAEVIGNWTGIPVGRMVSEEIKTVLELEKHMAEQVVGQDHALKALAESIRTSHANITDPNRPVGVFMLVGTSGVGKTETAKVLSDLLFGGDQNMTVINMAEFKEEHKVSLLMGSPPGYIGYGEGGVLTEAVRRKPYSVVLLDELEKAHPGVQDVFYRMFDEGIMTDGEGRDIDFRNTVILMTTNAGTETIMSLCDDPETMPDSEGLGEALRPELLKTFKPAFLGRVTVLPYFPLQDEVLKKIIKLKIGKISKRVEQHYGATLDYSDELIENVASRCTEVESGARNVDHVLTRTLQPELATEFLARMADGLTTSRVSISVAEDGSFQYDLA